MGSNSKGATGAYGPNLRVDVSVEHMTHQITQIIQSDTEMKKRISTAIQKAILDLDIDALAKDAVNMHMRDVFNKMLEDHRVKASVQELIIDSVRIQLMTAGVAIKEEALKNSRAYRELKKACEIGIKKNLERM